MTTAPAAIGFPRNLPPGVFRGRVPERPVRGALPSGISAVDDLLGGGLPRGAVTEVFGRESSGKTTLLLHWLARATSEGVVALVDAGDRFDPNRAAGAGIRLERLLWARRLEDGAAALRSAEVMLQTKGLSLVALDLGDSLPPRQAAALSRAWTRLRHHAASSGVPLLLLSGEDRLAGPAAHVAVSLAADRVRWTPHRLRMTLFDGFEARASVVRAWNGAPGDERSFPLGG